MAISRLIVIFACVFCIAMVDGGRPPSLITEPPQSFIFRDHDAITLHCQADGQPTATIQWKKNDVNVAQDDPRIKAQQDGSLVIEQTRATDEGFYQCFATNQYGTAVSVKSYVRRAYLAQSQGVPQEALQKRVTEGDSFYIQASHRDTFPEPEYSWELAAELLDKNPVPVVTSTRIQIAPNGDLHFAHAKPEDGFNSLAKLYKDVIYNSFIDVKAGGNYTQLTVTNATSGNKPPTLAFSSPSPLLGLAGKTVSLRCFFGGRPEPKVIWSVKTGTLPTGRYRIIKYESELEISNLQASDEGEYICTGSNPTGQVATHTIQLRVEEVPRFATASDGPRNVNVTEGSTVIVNCSAVGKPQPDAVAWFRNGQPLDTANLPARFTLSRDNKQLTISNVCLKCQDVDRQSDITVLQCNASNTHGYAFRSGYINISSVGSLTAVVTWSVLLFLGFISIRLV